MKSWVFVYPWWKDSCIAQTDISYSNGSLNRPHLIIKTDNWNTTTPIIIYRKRITPWKYWPCESSNVRRMKDGKPKISCFLPGTLFWLIFFSGWLSPCQIQRRGALGVRDVPVVGIHVPECKADGGFHPVQCDVISGYCWCVDEYGYEVEGSRIKGRPSCGKEVHVTFKIAIIYIF